jgi:hypothetical protein
MGSSPSIEATPYINVCGHVCYELEATNEDLITNLTAIIAREL